LVSSGALRLLAIVLLGVGSTANAVNVDDFGAVGDGKTWDHNAIQAAINAAGIGGVVEFSPGKVYVQCKNLLPAQGQVLRGNGAILKRCDPPLARLLEDAAAGAQVLIVDDPGVFELGQSLTPVKGAGTFDDGESVVAHYLRSITGNRLEISLPLKQSYAAGSLVTVKFDQIYIQNSSTGVTIEDLILDGNRSQNQIYLAWTDNKAIRGYSGMTVRGVTFRNIPGNAITVFGTDVIVDRNIFHDLDGPIVHLSGNEPVNGSEVLISRNDIRRTNAQAERMQHSEGVITISAENNSIRVIDNTVINAPVPFISRLHADMRDWVIRGNRVYGTAGAFYAKVWPGEPLKDVIWEDNSFFHVGESRSEPREGAAPITNFVFRRNKIIGGSLHLHGHRGGEITDNVIWSCGAVPLSVTGSLEVEVARNETSDVYCPLRVAVGASPRSMEEPGGLVSYTVTIANDAVEADPVAYSGMTVRRLTDLLSAGSSLGGLCAPELPHLLRPGESLVCKVDRNINEWPGFLNTFTVEGRLQNGTNLTSRASVRVTIRDVTPPVVTPIGDNPMILNVGRPYVELGARALDNRDGDLTSSVTASSAGVDFMNPGEYEVQYRVQDLSGNVGVAVRRVVVVAGPGAEGRAKDGGKGSLDVAALLCLAGVLILRLLGRWNSVAAATGSSSGVFLSRGSSCPSASNSSIIKDASR
jgi:hypothetical protein